MGVVMRDHAAPRTLAVQARYLWVLLRRFRVTFLLLGGMLAGGTLLLWWLEAREGTPIPLGQAFSATYFLMLGQPTLALPRGWGLQVLFMALPPLAIVAVADGLVRFAFLFFARHRSDKEWFAVLAESLQDHVIVCGAGRVGYRVLEQVARLGIHAVVIERREDAPFVAAIRQEGVPILVEDVRGTLALERANVRHARAVVCATDDDLANLNTALDARRLHPGIRIVMRLFDDDLVEKARTMLGVDAFSTSALAAPAIAVAALDPAICTSFEVGGVLRVVWEEEAGASLADRTVDRLRDQDDLLVLRIVHPDGSDATDPRGDVRVSAGDRLTLQATLDAYRRLRSPD